MTENTGSSGENTPPEDPRPRPRYGELAPEGWTWTPPQEPAAPAAPAGQDAAAPNQAQQPQLPTPPSAPQHYAAQTYGAPYNGAQLPKRTAPLWDRPVTLALMVFGLFGTFFTVAVLNAIPDAMQMLYTQEDLGTYKAAASVGGLTTAGIITQVVLWVAMVAVSVLLLVRRRRAFYVPLIGGVLSVLAIFVFLGIILTTDPTLLDFYSQQ
ncbi:DUF6264 family protein [Leifsonia sp. A12D58]|uniref:DUF6264 family protein n=1 Tax=Leifsonia sp. A12D58 TaxID=3397674 RepID=UPI0039E1AC45